jgi:hypothetical protein
LPPTGDLPVHAQSADRACRWMVHKPMCSSVFLNNNSVKPSRFLHADLCGAARGLQVLKALSFSVAPRARAHDWQIYSAPARSSAAFVLIGAVDRRTMNLS